MPPRLKRTALRTFFMSLTQHWSSELVFHNSLIDTCDSRAAPVVPHLICSCVLSVIAFTISVSYQSTFSLNNTMCPTETQGRKNAWGEAFRPAARDEPAEPRQAPASLTPVAWREEIGSGRRRRRRRSPPPPPLICSTRPQARPPPVRPRFLLLLRVL